MRLLALVINVLILGGCVEYRESLVLERDRSGTVVMAIGVKDALLRAAEVADAEMYDPAAVVTTLQSRHRGRADHAETPQTRRALLSAVSMPPVSAPSRAPAPTP